MLALSPIAGAPIAAMYGAAAVVAPPANPPPTGPASSAPQINLLSSMGPGYINLTTSLL